MLLRFCFHYHIRFEAERAKMLTFSRVLVVGLAALASTVSATARGVSAPLFVHPEADRLV